MLGSPAAEPAEETTSRTSEQRVAVVIVNYKRGFDTVRAVASLENSGHSSWNAIVVDNASTATSYAELVEALPGHTVIASEVNLGFAGGCNLGVRIALEQGFAYIYLLNNDAVAGPGALGALVSASKAHADNVLLGSVVRHAATGEYQFFGARRDVFGEPKWFEASATTAISGPISTDFIFGAAFFAPAELFKRIGLFDERFFLNYEETDFCFRASSRGIYGFVIPESVVLHNTGASLGAVDGPMQAYFLMRNEMLFLEKHGTPKERLLAYRRRALVVGQRVARDVLTRGGLELSTRSLLLGLRDYLLRRFYDCPPIVREYAKTFDKVTHCEVSG